MNSLGQAELRLQGARVAAGGRGAAKAGEDGGTCGHGRRFEGPLCAADDGMRRVGGEAQVFGWKTGGWQLYFLSWGGGGEAASQCARRRPG